jgi:hypothetical protein
MDRMDLMDGMDPNGEALHRMRAADSEFVSSLLISSSPLLALTSPRRIGC